MSKVILYLYPIYEIFPKDNDFEKSSLNRQKEEKANLLPKSISGRKS